MNLLEKLRTAAASARPGTRGIGIDLGTTSSTVAHVRLPLPESSAAEFACECLPLATRPHICWRLVQLLIPLQSLLIAIREQVHNDDLALGGADTDSSIPFMEEFLDFVCDDKTIILESEHWP